MKIALTGESFPTKPYPQCWINVVPGFCPIILTLSSFPLSVVKPKELVNWLFKNQYCLCFSTAMIHNRLFAIRYRVYPPKDMSKSWGGVIWRVPGISQVESHRGWVCGTMANRHHGLQRSSPCCHNRIWSRQWDAQWHSRGTVDYFLLGLDLLLYLDTGLFLNI